MLRIPFRPVGSEIYARGEGNGRGRIDPGAGLDLRRLLLQSNRHEDLLRLFCEAGSGARVPKEFESTALFFGWLIKCLSRRRPSKLLSHDARWLMMQRLAIIDPRGTAEQPGCGYIPPLSLVEMLDSPTTMVRLCSGIAIAAL
jgi:hypothetical protein